MMNQQRTPATLAPQPVVLQDVRKDRKLTKLSTTDATAVYTANAREVPIVELIWISNTDGSNACNATLQLHDATANVTYTLQAATQIAAGGQKAFPNDAVRFDGIPLREGDEIRVTAQNANDLEVLVVARVTAGNLR